MATRKSFGSKYVNVPETILAAEAQLAEGQFLLQG
jgi:hypothetical protein